MALRLAIIALALTLSACGKETISNQYDPEVYAYAFQQCQIHTPKGPTTTEYNDWDEVIEQCRYTAASISEYCPQPGRCFSDQTLRADVRKVLPNHEH